MSLNDTPQGERVHIAFFGCRNAGKSSLVNAFTGQELAIVSDVKGTTTDPVRKAMELLPLGPVMIIDTPGIDDEGALGEQRVARARKVLQQADIAILVVDSQRGLARADEDLLALFRERQTPYIIAWNKIDLQKPASGGADEAAEADRLRVSSLTGEGVHELKERVASLAELLPKEHPLIGDLVEEGDAVVLVVPIDKAAPKGRLILPQQQVIRDALDHGAMPFVCRETELERTLGALKEKPRMVITDSQVFKYVDSVVPEEIPLTSFSILMARYKGILADSAAGAMHIDTIKEGDSVLVAEACTHHRQCEDIGTVKLPRLLKKYTGAEVRIETSAGTGFPDDLSRFKLILHCGGCMITPKEAQRRYALAKAQGIPITNYGIAIAHMQGILARSIRVFGQL